MAQNIKMPTSADIMSMWNASGLKAKIIFTFLMIAAFRFGVQLPIFGINNEIFSRIAGGNNIIGFLDLFSGGALGKVSIFALGIGPCTNYCAINICSYSFFRKTSKRRR